MPDLPEGASRIDPVGTESEQAEAREVLREIGEADPRPPRYHARETIMCGYPVAVLCYGDEVIGSASREHIGRIVEALNAMEGSSDE